MKKALIWKLLERVGVLGGQFILQIILARLLDPEHYGVLSVMIIFTTLANVFIQNGFNTALIQNKDVEERDYSSVFWVSLGVAGILYAVIYVASPMIADFYAMPDIITPLRVLALILFPGALNSVQIAKVRREMDFKKIFYSNLGAFIIAGIIGIIIAYNGGGLWALVAQSSINVFVSCIIMSLTSKLRIRLCCEVKRVKILFSFGWKLLVSSLLNTLYQDLRSLVIGKKYDSGTLGYYNRGKQFPQLVMNVVNDSVQSVMLPALSKEQDDRAKVKSTMRTSMTLGAYIIFPMMAGLAGVAPALIELLLTEKWLPCVPYMQIYCFTMAFYPVHSCNLQAINAVGRSDIFLKLEVIKKSIGVGALVVAVIFFSSPIAIAMTGAITTIISCFINSYPNKKLISYSYFEQIKDLIPSLMASFAMLGCVLLAGTLALAPILVMLIQIAVGIIAYLLISVLFKMKPFAIALEMAKKGIRKLRKAEEVENSEVQK